jgi:hypothetical protein
LSTYIWILLIVVTIMALYLLYYTVSIANGQKTVKGKYDSAFDDSVKEHPYLRNPIFVSMFVGTVLVAGFVFYYTFK